MLADRACRWVGELRRILLPMLLACAATACSAPAEAPVRDGAHPPVHGTYRYRVRLDPGLGVLRAELCFRDAVPRALVPLGGDAADFLRWAASDDGRPLAHDGGRILVGNGRLRARRCIQYAVDLLLAARTSRYVSRYGSDLLTSSGAWLWRPDPLPAHVDATIRFELPEGVRLLTAWPPEDGAYRLDSTALRWRAAVAFGKFRLRALRLPGAILTYARLGAPEDPSDAVVSQWLGAAGLAVAGIEGRFPVPRVAVAVAPAPPGPDPVAFGMVQRGGGPSVFLLPRRGAKPQALFRDWVAVHEMSHLLLPHMLRGDAWLSEGIATYYEEVARARAGMLPVLDVWRDMEDGFDRGRKAGTGRTLEQESRDMYRTYAFRRVYWAGAAFALEADVRLRSAHGTSLDEVLARLSRLPGIGSRAWAAADLLHEMDDVSRTHVFTSLAATYLHRTTFPDVAPLLARLGVVRDSNGELAIDDHAPLASLRRAIMRPSNQPTRPMMSARSAPRPRPTR